MNNQLGAHELLEIKEVLDKAKSGIQLIQMYRPFVSDKELEHMMEHQVHFMQTEYNTFVSNLGVITESPGNYHAPTNVLPSYGLEASQPFVPDMDIDDRDIASALLGLHKSAAGIKLQATLECADPELRNILMQSVTNCVNKAYEIWNYMNNKGFYQVPILSDDDSHNIINSYEKMTRMNY